MVKKEPGKKLSSPTTKTKSPSLSDTSWRRIFNDYNALDDISKNGFFDIDSKKINKYREARLMAKHDSSKNLPKIFSENKLAILPMKNGSYRIGKYVLFQNLIYDDIPSEIVNFRFTNFPLETIDPADVYSEANALHIAFLSGMLDKVLGEEIVQTISGKMHSDSFDFNVKTTDENIQKISVNNVQVEIDGGYEGKTKVMLVEAKRDFPASFNIRQLYYPFRVWRDVVKKEISSVFFTFKSGEYRTFEYEFSDKNLFNSIVLKKQRSFVIRYPNTVNDLQILINEVSSFVVKEKANKAPFPQANNVHFIFQTLKALDEGSRTAKEVAEKLDFDVRQGRYYIDACRYLGLASRVNKGQYEITDLGKKIAAATLDTQKNKEFCKCIIRHEVFYVAIKSIMKDLKVPPKNKLINILKKNKISLSEETISRRSDTIRAWITWILNTRYS